MAVLPLPLGRLLTPRKILLVTVILVSLMGLFLTKTPTAYLVYSRQERFLGWQSPAPTKTTLTTTTTTTTKAAEVTTVTAPMADANKTKLELCPTKSPYLVGTIKENLDNVTLTQLDRLFSNTTKPQPPSKVDHGGHYYPSNCTARQKLAIIIPFRDRHHHLPILLHNLVPVLRRQLLDFRIYIIEQEAGVTFNRGLLSNVGFITALSRDRFDCMVLHDVDCLPLNDNILYQCGDQPRHLLAAGSKWNFGLSYPSFTGGALLMSREQYIKINGYSNLYFGWGSEDDDIRIRITHNKYKVLRYPKTIGRYYQIGHKRDVGNEENSERFPIVRKGGQRSKVEGLRSTVFKVKSIEEEPFFTWVRVSVNMTKVLQTAPVYVQPAIKKLVVAGKEFDKQGLGHAGVGDKFEIPL